MVELSQYPIVNTTYKTLFSNEQHSLQRTGFRYWNNPGAFAEYKLKGSVGRFVGVWSTMVQA